MEMTETEFDRTVDTIIKHQALRNGAQVRRFHTHYTHASDTVASHSWGVAVLVDLFYNGRAPAHMLRAALYHDVAEAEFGDIPSPAKRAMDTHALHQRENMYLHERGLLIKITQFEEDLLKTADIIDGLTFCCEETERGNRTLLGVWNTYREYLVRKISDMEQRGYSESEGATYTVMRDVAGQVLGILQARMEAVYAIGK